MPFALDDDGPLASDAFRAVEGERVRLAGRQLDLAVVTLIGLSLEDGCRSVTEAIRDPVDPGSRHVVGYAHCSLAVGIPAHCTPP